MRNRITSFLRRSLVLGAVAAITALTAAAQNITYTFSGVGSGTLGVQSFAQRGFSFSVTVPTASILTSFDASSLVVRNVVMNFTINTVGSGTLSGAYVFTNRNSESVGFGAGIGDLITLRNIAGLATYDMITPFGPVTATGSNISFRQFRNIPTNLSETLLTMTNVTTATFQATTGAPVIPGVVPEPSTYALLGTGLLAIGGIARRRRAHA